MRLRSSERRIVLRPLRRSQHQRKAGGPSETSRPGVRGSRKFPPSSGDEISDRIIGRGSSLPAENGALMIAPRGKSLKFNLPRSCSPIPLLRHYKLSSFEAPPGNVQTSPSNITPERTVKYLKSIGLVTVKFRKVTLFRHRETLVKATSHDRPRRIVEIGMNVKKHTTFFIRTTYRRHDKTHTRAHTHTHRQQKTKLLIFSYYWLVKFTTLVVHKQIHDRRNSRRRVLRK